MATGKIHRANMGHLSVGTSNLAGVYAEARMYWSGSLLNKSLNGVEILFEGDATVIEVVDEKSIT